MTAVLHVITGLGLGGAERMLVETVVGLQRRGLAQYVVSLRGRGHYASTLEAAGVPVLAFDIKSAVQACTAMWECRQLVKRLRPDVIQGWMYHGDLSATAVHLLVRGRSQRSLFWNIRASNMDDGRYSRVIRVCGWLSAWPDVVIANSQAGAHFHSTEGYRPRRVGVIPNGIDTQRFRPDPVQRLAVRAELGLAEEIVVIHVARVDPMKDHETFISAIAGIPGVTGLLVGAGTEGLVLPRNVRAIGVRRDMERLYAAADIVASSSAYGEGFSNALAEGMSAGLVPIATDVGDSATIVGSTGHVVTARDPSALADAIRTEARLSADQRRSRGMQARARISGQYSPDRAVDSYVRLYQEIAAAKAP